MCACCGEARMGFLTVDHINGGGNAHKREIGSKLYSLLRKSGFPSGYRILCFNCNIASGLYGRCPHLDPSAGVAESSPHAHRVLAAKREADRRAGIALAGARLQ